MQALTELFRGQGSHADPIGCIEDLAADLANRRIEGFPHSIADLVFHMNYWMSHELQRIRGEKPKYPEHNAESFPPSVHQQGVTPRPTPVETKKDDWDRLKRDFAAHLAEFAKLAESPRKELDRQVEPAHDGDKKLAGTLEAVLWQMVAHNSYHVGQIALIRRALNAWPPKAGGDSW
jgi:uncharacterized damage-inducible protein DinB